MAPAVVQQLAVFDIHVNLCPVFRYYQLIFPVFRYCLVTVEVALAVSLLAVVQLLWRDSEQRFAENLE